MSLTSAKIDERVSQYATRVGARSTKDAIHLFLSAIGSPRAIAVWMLYEYGEHDQLTRLEIDPEWYLPFSLRATDPLLFAIRGPFAFRDDYTATKFLSKAEFLKTSLIVKRRLMRNLRNFQTSAASPTNDYFTLLLKPIPKG